MTTEKDYNINTQYDGINQTLLMESVMNEDFELVEILINRGADLELKDKGGDTALLLSVGVFTKNRDIPSLLIKNGADVNAHNIINDSTPLCYAIYADRDDMVKLLLDSGADINWTDRYGMTPLMLALFFDKVYLANLLITRGADIHHQNSIGWNALIYAIIREHTELVELLLSKKIEFDIEDKNGDNAMKFALRCKDSSIKDILLKYGVKEENSYNVSSEYNILTTNKKSLFWLEKKSLKITNKKIILEDKTSHNYKKIEIYLYQLVDYTIVLNSKGVDARESQLSKKNRIMLDLDYESIDNILENFIIDVRRKGYLNNDEIVEIKNRFLEKDKKY